MHMELMQYRIDDGDFTVYWFIDYLKNQGNNYFLTLNEF